MKTLLLLILLSSCEVYTRGPADIIPTREVYCQPLSEYRQECRDEFGVLWHCTDRFGRWECHRHRGWR